MSTETKWTPGTVASLERRAWVLAKWLRLTAKAFACSLMTKR